MLYKCIQRTRMHLLYARVGKVHLLLMCAARVHLTNASTAKVHASALKGHGDRAEAPHFCHP